MLLSIVFQLISSVTASNETNNRHGGVIDSRQTTIHSRSFLADDSAAKPGGQPVSEVNCSSPSDPGKTPLYIACENGNQDEVARLLRRGCLVDTQTSDGRTPLFVACEKGHLDIVELLLKRRASVK